MPLGVSPILPALTKIVAILFLSLFVPRPHIGTSTATGASLASASPLFAFETMLRSFVPLPPPGGDAAANEKAEFATPSMMDPELEARLNVEDQGLKEDDAAINAQKQDALAVVSERVLFSCVPSI